MRRRNVLVATLALALVACGDKSPTGPKRPSPPSYANPTYTVFTEVAGSAFGIDRRGDGYLLTSLIYDGAVERLRETNAGAAHDGLSLGGIPTVLAIAPSGGAFYVANMSGWVDARDFNTGGSVGRLEVAGAHALAISPSGDRLYVASSNGFVAAIDRASLTPVAEIPVPGGPWGFAFRQGTSPRVYVTARDGGTITEINPSNNTVVRTISVGGRPHGLVISADGTRLYAADDTEGRVKIIDIATGFVTKEIPFSGAFALAMSPDGYTIYAASNENRLAIIDVPGGRVVRSFSTAGQPRQIVVTPDGNTAYAANMGGWIDRVTR